MERMGIVRWKLGVQIPSPKKRQTGQSRLDSISLEGREGRCGDWNS